MFIIRTPPSNSESVQEWIDGAGGTERHLCSLIVQNLDFIVPQPIHGSIHFQTAVILIGQLLKNKQLLDALLKCGLVRALTGLIIALLTENIGYDVEDKLNRALTILLSILTGPKISIIQREGVPRAAARILEVSLPSFLAHYRVVAQVDISMMEAMPAIQRLVTAQKECQTVGWREAGHRAVCESFRVSDSDAASTRDRAFMRAVVHHTYESARPQLFRRQILFMRENPDAEFYCLFNFKCVPPTFGVYPVRDLPRTDPVWIDCIERAHRSEGRMEVHLVDAPDGTHENVVNGANDRSRILPLRSTSSDIQTGLPVRAIANTGADESTLEKEIEKRVKVLLRRTQDVMQTHCEQILPRRWRTPAADIDSLCGEFHVFFLWSTLLGLETSPMADNSVGRPTHILVEALLYIALAASPRRLLGVY
ncbi:hypothetical protein C8R44DRAFT_882120 [Mycena epipterygia]|nr:hypothetical protein C8R44DRAFT_882120 [Mycena epipterygia]